MSTLSIHSATVFNVPFKGSPSGQALQGRDDAGDIAGPPVRPPETTKRNIAQTKERTFICIYTIHVGMLSLYTYNYLLVVLT